MSLHFTRPLLLLLLIAVAALFAFLAWRGASGWSRSRVVSTVLAALSLILLVLALSGPGLGGASSGRGTVVAVDRSASVDAAERRQEADWTRAAQRAGCAVPCPSVRFAGSADAVGGSPSGTRATNLESALSAAVALSPRGGRVVVLSDGGATQGDADSVLGLAASRRIAVDWVRLDDASRRDASIAAIHLPSEVRVGDEVPLSVTVHSSVAASAVLKVQRDNGAPASQTIKLRAGDNPLLLSYSATRPGWNSFTVTIALAGDQVSANDSDSAVVDVRPAPRVLVVSDQANSPVPSLLAGQHLDVSEVSATGLPTAPGSYADYDALVLDDIPATSLSATQVSALDAAVRVDGLGLLALGGPHSFSEGKYWKSKLQQILPVRSLKPGKLQRRNLAVELVLDHSGSMIDLAGGAPKIAEARASARQAAAFIAKHQDQLGIVDFDTAAHLLLPLQTVTRGGSEKATDARIDTLEAEGGTNIYAGLQAGFRELLKSRAPQRHLILLTDGISTGADYGGLLALMRKEKISAATIALGADADRALLAKIASATGGHTYVTDNASDLPKILVKETQRSAKPVRITGRLAVGVSTDSPVIRSLSGVDLAPVSGDIVTKLKPGAQTDLSVVGQGAEPNPGLAQWQIGAGRVLAWTPGLGAPWGESWLKQTTLWSDAVRWTDRPMTVNQVQPAVSASGVLSVDLASRGAAGAAVTGLRGSLISASGTPHPVILHQTGPATYAVDVSTLPAGVYRYALSTVGAAGAGLSGELAVPYPAEYSPATAHVSSLGQLVSGSGGQILPVADPGRLGSGRHALDRLLALIALILFLAGVGVRLVGGLRRPRIHAG